MLRAITVSLVALQLLSPRLGWAAVNGSAQGGRPTMTTSLQRNVQPAYRPEATPIQYDGDRHHHHGLVLIGCVHVPDECHHAAERAGYHHFRIVFDPDTCHPEPHLACVADG